MAARIEGVARPARQASSFYVAMAVAFAVIAFGGFTRTYFLPLATNRFDGPTVAHVHGALFFAWVVLLVVQSTLVERRRVDAHRALGLLGISLATAMVGSGLAMVARGLDAAGAAAPARVLAIVPVSQILLFAAFFVAAIANVRRPEAHKRLMLLATANLLTAPVARLIGLVLAPDGPRPSFATAPPEAEGFLLAVALLVDLLVVVAIVRDWRTRGRPHRAYLIGGACMLLVHALRGPLARTTLWQSITDALAALAA